MSWGDFVEGMGSFSVNDVGDWCVTCNSISLFCEALYNNIGNDTSSGDSGSGGSGNAGSHMSNAIAGVIGATVTLAVWILLATIFLLTGGRVGYRRHSGRPSSEQPPKYASGAGTGTVFPAFAGMGMRRSGGGFKGSDKKMSDPDVDLAATGGKGGSVVKHERVGSWEMGAPSSPSRSIDKEIEEGGTATGNERVRSHADYGRRSIDEDLFTEPVRPVDHV